MTKKICFLLLAVLVLLAVSGCASVFEAEYDYEEPVTGDFGTLSGNATEIRNYSMLKTALTDMISRREERGEFRLNNYNGSPTEDLAQACYEIKSASPLGAYAVETMSYDTSYVVSYYMANIYISYKRTAEEIESVVYARTLTEFDDCVRQTVDEFRPEALVRIYSAVVDEGYIRKLVRKHYYDTSQTMVLEPKLTVESFPNEGVNRIYSICFGYDQTQLRTNEMAGEISGVLDGAVREMTETEPLKLALEIALWLSNHCTVSADADYGDTAYGALVKGCADSKGMALAYAALCRRLEIPCLVVEGSVGAMGAEPHFWNMINLDDAYYHADVSALAETPAASFLLSDADLWGIYIWNIEDYPVCSGSYTYADAAGLPASALTEEHIPDSGRTPTENPAENLPDAEPETAPVGGKEPVEGASEENTQKTP